MKRKGKKYDLALILDMNKAYDRMKWDFLEVLLRRMGFEETWIGWVMEFVKIVSYSLVINRKTTPKFCHTIGIRQGDPMSPYLFLFVIDVLSKSILRRAQVKAIEGLKLSIFCLELTHLLFANDSLFFFKANRSNCKVMTKCTRVLC